MKLGKLPPKHDPRTYKLTSPLTKNLVAVPDIINWSAGIRYDMSGNDQYGDCAFATRTAMLLTWTTLAHFPLRLTETQTLSDYSQCTGFDLATGMHDNGTILLDALNMWCQEGFSRPGQTRDYLTTYGILDHKNHDAVKRAIYALGGVYLGIQVPQYLMNEGGDWAFEPNADWTVVGGHCIAALGYDDTGVIIFTWGSTRRMSWELWDAIVDECYGLVSLEDQMTIHGKNGIGIDLQGLVSELRASVG